MIAQSLPMEAVPLRPDPALPTPLLGGLTPRAFMRRHWQKKPLLVRQAVPGGVAWADRARLLELAARDTVESRLIVRQDGRWTLRQGPLRRLPPLKQREWTLLVQGVDLHQPEARALLDRFRFVPDARLDDLMLSFASDGGGVGPHVDSYDVFLLQARGRRRWGIRRPTARPAFVPDVPLRLLADFEPEAEWLLEPGDLLYLPPGWAHEGVADGACVTCSIGFRAAGRDELARDVLQRLVDGADTAAGPLYRDADQPAVETPGRIPAALQAFAAAAVARLAAEPRALDCALGEVLSEPKPGVGFAPAAVSRAAGDLVLDRASRMLYDATFVFLNGESYRAAGRDAVLMRRLADDRALPEQEQRRLSPGARAWVEEWLGAGWIHRSADRARSTVS